MEFILQLFEYSFLQRALLTSVIVGIISGIIGSFIVLRGMALMGDAISHAVLPGIAISYMLSINFFYGAVIAGLFSALGIGYVSENSRIKNDSSIGIVFSAFFALGVLLISKAQTAQDLTQILFGNVLAVSAKDMYLTLGVGSIVLLIVFLFYKELLITSFDETTAKVFGLRTSWINYLVMILLTLVTVASLKTVGVILVVAMLITPASTAYLLTNQLRNMIYLAAFFGAISSIIGLYISFSFNLQAGPIIVLVSTFFFSLAFFFSPSQGVLWRKLKKPKNNHNL